MTEPIRIELPTVFGMKTVNAYLLVGEEVILVDCGEDSDESWAALQHGLKENRIAVKDLDRVIITHGHVDHLGMANRVVENCDAKVLVNQYTYDWAAQPIEMWAERGQAMGNAFKFYLGEAGSQMMLPIFKDISVKMLDAWKSVPTDRLELYQAEGQLILNNEPWQVLYAPGHSNTQSCFYHVESEQLISADMVLSITPTPVMEKSHKEPYEREIGILKMMESYERFSKLKVRKVYPGHYAEFDNCSEVIANQISRIEKRTEECYQLIQSGVGNTIELFQKMYSGRWHGPAINMLIGYIDLLEARDRILIEDHTGTAFISAK